MVRSYDVRIFRVNRAPEQYSLLAAKLLNLNSMTLSAKRKTSYKDGAAFSALQDFIVPCLFQPIVNLTCMTYFS